jgi:hypothetical protein
MLATALLVARPLVKGDNLDLLAEAGEYSGLTLTLLWLLAAALWALWRVWAQRDEVYVGGVELGLAIVVGCVFVAAEVAAPYKHLARLIAWEWLGLLAALFVLRQLAVTPQERQGLVAVLLASVVSVAVYAIYQWAVEFPQLRALAANPEKLRLEMAAAGVAFEPEQVRRRIQEGHIFGTYSHPNSFAGYLALLIPGLAGAAWAARQGPRWRLGLTMLCLAVGLTALFLTHSRGAILALALVGAAIGVFFGRRWLAAHKGIALGGAAALIAAAALAWYGGALTAGLGKGTGSMAVRLEYWRGTWRMIEAKPWLGVGPGQFRRAYPRFMDETAVEKIADPHNFALEMWSTAGPLALAALLFALAWFGLRAVRSAAADVAEEPQTPAPHAAHWPFYVGGMIGLLMGFLLGLPDQVSSTEVLNEGFTAAGRSVVWFLVYGLLERVVWSERTRIVALTGGAVALLLNWCVSGGVSFPQVALPLWACVALVLNAPPLRPARWAGGGVIGRALPAALLPAGFLCYFAYLYYPITSAQNLARQALRLGRLILSDAEKPPSQQEYSSPNQRASALLLDVVVPLQRAHLVDPGNSRLLLWWAEWSVIRDGMHPQPLDYRPNLPSVEGERERTPLEKATGKVDDKGARDWDPENAECYELPYQLYERYAARLKAAAPVEQLALAGCLVGPGLGALPIPSSPPLTARTAVRLADSARKEYRRAAAALTPLALRYDPTSPRLRYLLAAAYFRADDKTDPETWRQQARQALRLDDLQPHQVGEITRALQPDQRRELEKWLALAPEDKAR